MATTGGHQAPGGPKPKPKKKVKKKKPARVVPRGRPQPKPKPPAYFNPFKQQTAAQIEAAAKAAAQAEIAPRQAEIDRAARQQASANQARVQDLTAWHGNQQSQLDKAFADTTAALNSLITTSSGAGKQAQDSLAAALRAGGVQQADMAKMIGGGSQPAPPSDEAATLAGAAANDAALRQHLSSLSGAYVTGAGERRGLASIGQLQAQDAERRRYNAELQETDAARRGLSTELGQLTSAKRTELENQYAERQMAQKQFGEARANRLFQQYIAQQELGLKKKNQTFQEWLAREGLKLDTRKQTHQEKVDWKQIGISQQQVNNELKRLEAEVKSAKTAEEKEAAVSRRDAYQSGLEVLQGYLSPTDQEVYTKDVKDSNGRIVHRKGDPRTRRIKGGPRKGERVPIKQRNFNDAYRLLQQAGIPAEVALNLLARSDYASWRNRAKRMMQTTGVLAP